MNTTERDQLIHLAAQMSFLILDSQPYNEREARRICVDLLKDPDRTSVSIAAAQNLGLAAHLWPSAHQSNRPVSAADREECRAALDAIRG